MEETTQLLDFLAQQNNTGVTSLKLVAISLVLSFVLAVVVVITYQLTTPLAKQNRQFLQALILLALVAAMIMMAIGDNIARGLGILGALSIIRFRTNISNPRNITFTFASLAIGLACGIHGYTVAVIGTMIFCLVAVFLRFSWFGMPRELNGKFKIEAIHSDKILLRLQESLKQHCRTVELTEIKHLQPANKQTIESTKWLEEPLRKAFTFQVLMRETVDSAEVYHEIINITGVERVFFEQTSLENDV